MTWPLLRRWGCLLVVATASLAARAQSPPADWLPYREAASTEAPLAEPTFQQARAEDASVATTAAAEVIDPRLVFPQAAYAAPLFEAPVGTAPCYIEMPASSPTSPEFWQWRLLPEGVIWQSYWAGAHEPRIAGVPFGDQHDNANLDVTLGGRASLVRFGSDAAGRPMGAELQIEGAAFPRLNLDENWDLDATDFRFGLPLVYGREQWEAKFSYYHLSSHMGDEFAEREMAIGERINFSRDSLVAALAFRPLPAWRWYAEAGWAFYYDGGSEPWEFQVGVDVAEPGPTGAAGAPFFAVNGHLREEHNFGGNLVVQAGWLWRGQGTRTTRLGIHYYNGKSNQFEFFDNFEQQLGGGVWYEY
jgi:hypothetical protein